MIGARPVLLNLVGRILDPVLCWIFVLILIVAVVALAILVVDVVVDARRWPL